MDEEFAQHVEALARKGFDGVYEHIVNVARLVRNVAQGDLGHAVSLGRINPEASLRHTHVSAEIERQPEWLVDIYVDLELSEDGPSIHAMLQSDSKGERERFSRELQVRSPQVLQYDDRNFAGVRLTSLDWLRTPQEAAAVAGHSFAQFLMDVSNALRARGD